LAALKSELAELKRTKDTHGSETEKRHALKFGWF
jgi:hypothetical protein